MKRIIIYFTITLISSTAYAQKFILNGKVKPSSKHTKVILAYVTQDGENVDSVAVVNGTFKFTGNIEEPAMAKLILMRKEGAVNDSPRMEDSKLFYLEPTVMEIISATDSIKQAKVIKSVINEDFDKYNASIQPELDKLNRLAAEFQSKPESERTEIYKKNIDDRQQEINSEIDVLSKKFAITNPNSYISLVNLINNSDLDKNPNEAAAAFMKMPSVLRNSTLGKRFAENIAFKKHGAVGTTAANFTLNNTDDKPVSLSDFKGKYILVDFWASWCGPCRGENPNVVKAYNMFKDKNFTIIGVSLDNPGKKMAWLNAIQKDGLTWTQVSDLKGWDSQVLALYGVNGIPMNFLIDPSGKIIAKDLRGKQLFSKLESIFSK